MALASRPSDRDPSVLLWLIATISLILPWLGGALLLVGVAQLWREGEGWLLVGLGVGAIVLDLVIDFAWADPRAFHSDHPDLNRRGTELIGRIAIVDADILADSGKVRIGDTVWPAELKTRQAQAVVVGQPVRIMALKGTSLVVEPEPATPAQQTSQTG